MSSINHNLLKAPPGAPSQSLGSATPGTDAHDNATSHAVAHGTADAVAHAAHQTESSLHLAEKASHLIHEGAEAAAAERQLVGALRQTADAAPHTMRDLARVVEPTGGQVSVRRLAAAVPAHHRPAYTEALKLLAHYHQASNRATRLASEAGGVARQLQAAVAQGLPTEVVARRRTLLAHARGAVNDARARVQHLEPEAKVAREVLRKVHADVVEPARKKLSGMGYAVDYLQRLKATHASRVGRVAQQLVARVGESQAGRWLSTALRSKFVDFGGKALTAIAVGVDAWGSARKGATLEGNVSRASAQVGISSIMYTQAPALPIVAVETFFMDRPHLTGPLRTVPQLLGVAADYHSGGQAAGDRALVALDAEMAAGRLGAPIRLAHLVGQSLVDKGAHAVWQDTVSYWSNVNIARAWKDAKDAWAWARH